VTTVSPKKGPYELVDLILKNNPDASLEMMAAVTTEWGTLYAEQKFDDYESIDIECAAPNNQRLTGI